MAEQEAPAAEAPSRKLPIKTLLVVLVALVVEGVAIAGVFLMSGGPSPVQADPMAGEVVAAGERPHEVLVIDGKFQNTRSGRPYLYDTEIYIVVKQKYVDEIEQRREQFQAAIRSEVTTIFRRAQPAHLHEHELATLTRQIRAAMEERFGYDPSGEPYVQDCFLAEFKEFSAS